MLAIAAAPPNSKLSEALAVFVEMPFAYESIDELARKIPAVRRVEAIQALDTFNRAEMTPMEQGELMEAYAALAPASVSGSKGLLEFASERMRTGDYAVSEALLRETLKRNPNDTDALALFHSVKGRAKPLGGATGQVPIDILAVGTEKTEAPPVVSAPVGFTRRLVVPPTPGSRPLDPRAPDYWDRQLLGPLRARSDINPVAKQYLSPLLHDGKVTIRLVSRRDDPSIAGAWGTYNPETSIIRFNLDSINSDVLQYNSFYSRKSPARAVRPINSTTPLDAKQIEFLTGRFLPLAVHEAGGHGTHGDDLRKLLGTKSSPITKDTEILAWRLEAAAVEYEVRRDPSYLTEPTDWAKDESYLRRTWLESRTVDDPLMFLDYLNNLGYSHLIDIDGTSAGELDSISKMAIMIQSRCRMKYDSECSNAFHQTLAMVPLNERPNIEFFVRRLDAHPNDAGLRAHLARNFSELLIRYYRVDPRGIGVMQKYYSKQAAQVGALEDQVDPRTVWGRLRSAWGQK